MNLRDLHSLLDEETPAQVKRCVRSVGKKTGSLNRAFAICVAAGQKRGTLKKGTIEPTAKGKKADAAKKKDPEHDSKVGDYETMLTKARKRSEDVMPSLRTDMLRLLGETDQEDFKTRRDAGPTSTGVTNKPAKKTPADKKPPPNVAGSGDEGEASATASPKNSPAKKEPMKAGIAPPNVRGSGAVEHALRITRTYAGIDNKYGVKAGDMLSPEEEPYLSTIQEEASEDPILKIAREAMKSPYRSHPFE